ncbi:MAG: redoxin domain-containing protein [Planctomycetales bacterium]|nr:redoxin domain-containing protein [Planctomycetales bacterium]
MKQTARFARPISRVAKLAIAMAGVLVSVSSAAAQSPASSLAGSATFGKQLTRIDLDDYRGRRWQLDDFKSDNILVVAFLGTECPLAKLYAARLQSMQQELAEDGIRILAVMSNRHDSLLDITSFANRQQLTFPIVKDAGGRLASDLQASRTPEVFVFDSARKLRYQGRIDDQYGIGYVRDEPRRRDLRVALDELIAGDPVSVPKTDAVGCIIGRTKTVDGDANVTYGGQVADILNRNCVQCHREDEIAPFALTDYEEVAGWADMIAEVVRDQRMPPWHADPKHGHFANARMMTDEEKQILYDWAEAGAPAGDLSDLPKPAPKVSGWQLPREPDLVFNISEKPFTVPAEGTVRYQYFRVDPKLEKDVWIESAELKPGDRRVVHHILAFAVPKGQRQGLNGARGFLVGYVPGARVEPWPEGHAKRIPAGSELIFQVHYTPIGTDTSDQSELGFCLTEEAKVTHEIVTTSAVQPRLAIPPGDPDYEVSAASLDRKFPAGARLLSMSPHMHVRGKAFEYSLASNSQVLLSIPKYDFNWQTTYVVDEPMPLVEGDYMVCRAVFDNSKNNLNNPDPTATVRWGDQTWDEMMIGYYHLSVPRDGNDGEGDAEQRASQRRRMIAERAIRLAIFDRIDRDKDGKITKAETPKQFQAAFEQLDDNRDGTLTRIEAESK